MCKYNREECERPRNRSKVRFNPFSTYIYECKIAYDVPTLRHSHTSWLIPSLFLLRVSAWFSLMAWCLKEVAVRLTRKDNKTTHRRGDNLTSMSDLLSPWTGYFTSKICAKILMSVDIINIMSSSLLSLISSLSHLLLAICCVGKNNNITRWERKKKVSNVESIAAWREWKQVELRRWDKDMTSSSH